MSDDLLYCAALDRHGARRQLPPMWRPAEPAVPIGARAAAWPVQVLAAPGASAGHAMTPDLADLVPTAPLTRHYTSVAPAPQQRFAAACLCGWTGEPRTRAAQACTDANAHEGGAS